MININKIKKLNGGGFNAFTLIELLVVIVVIGILVTATTVILNSTRTKSRDTSRIANIKQIQTALDLYYANNNSYPAFLTAGMALVDASGMTFMKKVPSNPHPDTDGGCTSGTEYEYLPINNTGSYLVYYCLGEDVDNIVAGSKIAIPGNISAIPGSTELYTGNTGSTLQTECPPGICGDCNALDCESLIDFQVSNETCAVGSQLYQSVRVGGQCWLNQNINIGMIINGSTNMTDNSLLKKWCYNDSESYCVSNGALYTWSEAMYLPSTCDSSSSGNCAPVAYLTNGKRQGVCPRGWHLPSDNEFFNLEKYVQEIAIPTGNVFASDDVGSGGDYYADQIGSGGTTAWRGSDAGAKLKLSGSSKLNFILSGMRSSGNFTNNLIMSYIWTSTQYNSSMAWARRLINSSSQSYRSGSSKSSFGFSVRCLKN